MSGFSAEWLALREPADHRARDAGLLSRLSDYLQGRDSVSILDLGCGAGSNLRAMACALPVRCQTWRLVDYDPALLDAARVAVAIWARRKQPERPKLCLQYEAADLLTALPELIGRNCDVVTAAALLDLVSADWLQLLAERIAARRLPLYAVLNFDGAMSWQPPHAVDADIIAAFAAHQQTNKGFGIAAGSTAIATLSVALSARDYDIHTAPSPWQLGSEDSALIAATNAGIVQAARETGRLATTEIDAWQAARARCHNACIGHVDLLALPHV